MRLILVQPQLRHVEGADNFAAVRSALSLGKITPKPDDVLLLPERVTLTHSRGEYTRAVSELARELGCSVVGGSHHEDRGGEQVNAGIAVGPDGALLGEYEKVRPYASERAWVRGGAHPGEFVIGGRRFMVLICADFWFSDLFDRASALPDLVLVPALSVTRKPTPDYSRALWKHLAVARAYEFGAYVGISDWAAPTAGIEPFTSGVGGFSDPTAIDPHAFFQPIDGALTVFDLDFTRLDDFRRDRTERGFFWRKPTLT
jgi:predicted amidohydrolase